MAKKTAVIDLKVNSGVASAEFEKTTESVKSLKEQVRDTTKEAQLLAAKFGITSKEATEAQKRLTNLKEELNDFNDRVKNLDPGGQFKTLGTAVSQVAGGFTAAQGAAALFGAETEDLQKTMVKLQGALAISQGLEQLKDVGKTFSALKETALDALNGIKKAFLANPFFLVAAPLITGIAVAFAFLSNRTSEADKAIQDYNKSIDKATKENTKRLIAVEKGLDREIQLLRASGKETFELEKQKLQATIDRVKGELKALKSKRLFEIQTRQEEIKDLEQGGAASRFISKGLNKKLIEDRKKVNDEIRKLKEESDNATLALDVLVLTKQKETNDKNLDNYKKFLEEKNKADRDRNDKNLDNYKKFLEEKNKADRDRFEKLQKLEHDQFLAEIDGVIIQKNFKKETDAIKKEGFLEQVEQDLIDDDNRSKRREKEHKDFLERIKNEQLLRDAKIQIATNLTSSLASLGNILIKNKDKNEKFQKAAAVVQLGIDSAKAISGAVAQAQSVPFPFNLVAITAGVAAVIANISKAKQLLSKVGASNAPSLSIPSGGGGAAVLPEFANQPQIPNENINQQQADTSGQLITQRVFVTQGDIQSANENQNSILTKSTIQ